MEAPNLFQCKIRDDEVQRLNGKVKQLQQEIRTLNGDIEDREQKVKHYLYNYH